MVGRRGLLFKFLICVESLPAEKALVLELRYKSLCKCLTKNIYMRLKDCAK